MSDSTKWKTVEGCVRDLVNDPEATEWEKGMTEFRVAVVTLDGLRVGSRTLVETSRFERARLDLYAYVLDGIVRDIDTHLARFGQVAS